MNGMQFAEGLALCAGKSMHPSGEIGGGGRDRCLDLMAALAKADVPDLARRLVRWKYLDDPGEPQGTVTALRARFPLPDALLGAAIWEWLAPAICLTCCGGRSNSAYLDVCPACGGTGVSQGRKGAPAGLSLEEWGQWEGRYRLALDGLHDLTRLACIRAAELLTEPEEAA